MNRRGHVFYELWVCLVVALVFLAIAVPYLARGQWVAGGLWLVPVLLVAGLAVRGWWARRG
jgi:hypothetical protein